MQRGNPKASAGAPKPAHEPRALPRMKIVAIANQKGGVGKTTTAVNLGAALAESGKRILLVDLDPQANATSSFGLQGVEDVSLYDPLLGDASITEKILPTRREGLFIVPADLDMAGAEVEIARMPNHLTRLAETLKPLHTDQTFDFVFLDCPPSLGILMSNALAAADELLTPIQCEYFKERSVERGAELWEIHSGIRFERTCRAGVSGAGARVHEASRFASHCSRVIAYTSVGKPRNMICFSTSIPFFSATRRDGMFSG